LEKFVFYDLETTGISPAFDQPLQFAAIVTDLELNEIERVDIRCQLSPHILPSPKALAVTGVRPSQLENKNLPSAFEFAQTIQKFTEQWAPAIWIGYNSIAFDEAMLRQMFYQNLQPNIFATQFHNNTRLDVMKMVFAVHAEAPKILKWPLNDKGKVTFKLDQLAPLNGFHAHNAHDALGDVEATIFIVDIIKTQRPDLYKKLVQARDKERNLQLLKSFKPVDVTLRFGGNAPKTYTGCFCGLPRNNKNIVGFFDLNQSDPMDLIHGTDQDILMAMTESPQRIRSFRLNQADTIRPASVTSHEYNHICAVIKGNEEFQAMVSERLDNKYVNEEDIELRIEEKIFSGFYSYQDKELLQSFQSSTWSERLALLTEAQDDRIRQLGRRLVAFNASHLLEDKYQKIAQEYVAEKWSAIEPNVKWTTIASVTSQLAQLEAEGFDDKLLDEMKIFYRKRLKAQRCSVDF
jgi:exodeoxyribonuclease-1